MKKALIITYYWPPSGAAGVQRWLKFVKYLRNYGWEPVVFVPENAEYPSIDESLLKDVPEGVEILKSKIWEPYDIYKRFTGKKKNSRIQAGFIQEEKSKSSKLESLAVWIRGNFFIPDARKFWIKPSVKILSEYFKKNKVDVMVTTGPPHSAHLIGFKLKKKFDIPWLADFRDPWTNIDFYKDLKLSKYADKKHHKLEKTVLETADAVTVVSNGMKADFTAIHKRVYDVIPNGYDSEDVNKTLEKPVAVQEKFILSHVGSLNKDRNPINLLVALKELTAENKEFAEKLEIRNVGKIDVGVEEALKHYGLEKYFKKINYLPHDEVIEQQQTATILLLLINRTPNAKMIVTGKIFEYLISGRPVLCIGPEEGDAAYILKETGCGTVFDFEEKEKLKSYLLDAFGKYREGTLTPLCKNVEKYDRKNLTEKMAEVFNRITT